MHPMPVLCGHASRLVLVLLLILGASGCGKKEPRFADYFSCGDKKVEVNTTNGAEPQVVYVCEDDTVLWNSNGHKFLVEFKNDSPFKNDDKKFDNAKPKSDKTKHHDKPKVYEYRITVDGVQFDPQVLGGGKP